MAKFLSPPNRRGSDNGSSRDSDGDNPRLGEGASEGMTSGNSRATQGNSSADNSRNVGESKRGSKAPTDSGSGNWGMESMAQNMKGDNTQKPSGTVGRRPGLESKGDVNGVTTSRGSGDKPMFTGGTSSMKGMKGSRSGGSHGDFHDKRAKY